MKNLLSHRLLLTIYIALCLSNIITAQWIQQQIPANIGILLAIDIMDNSGISGGWAFENIPTGRMIYTTNSGSSWNTSIFPSSVRAVIYTKLFDNSAGIAAIAYNRSSKNKLNSKEYFNTLFKSNDIKKVQEAMLGIKRDEPTGAQILKTSDGGISWIPIYTFPDSIIYIVGGNFINETSGFVIAVTDSSRYLYKTTDGGVNWNFKIKLYSSYTFVPISFSNNLNGVMGGNDNISSLMFITSDTGETWAVKRIIQSTFITSVSYNDVNSFYASGFIDSSSVFFNSTDAGLNWGKYSFELSNHYTMGINLLPESSAGLIYGCTFPSDLIPFIGKTTDGGSSWKSIDYLTGLSDFIPTASKIVNDDKVFIVGGSTVASIIYNSNTGLPVQLLSLTAHIDKNTANLSWITATETNNKGFEVQKSSSINQNKNYEIIGFIEGKGTTTEKQFYSFIDDNVKPGKYFYRLKQIDYDGSFEYSNEIEVDVNVVNEFMLYQNYPNPFNPSTTIKYSISEGGRVVVDVFNILGKEVTTLTNEYKDAGNYEVKFNAASLTSGVYFYQVKAGNFSDTKKLLLMK